MNPGITEWLSDKQLQKFDTDSIKELLDKYKKTKELNENEFNIDGNDNLWKEEKIILKKLKESSTIINDLEELINVVDDKTSFFSTIWNFLWISEITDKAIKSTVETLMSKWNIPNNEELISVLDSIQYVVIWKEDEKVSELINLVKKSEEWDWFMRLEVSQYIWEFTWLIWTDLYNEVQKRMIEGAIWNNNKWFNDKYIVWFDENKWYTLKTIQQFENELNDEKYNYTMLLNYINYLDYKCINENKDFINELNNTKLNQRIKDKIIQLYKNINKERKKIQDDLYVNINRLNDINTKYIDDLLKRGRTIKLNNVINKITDKNKLIENIKYIKAKAPNYNFTLNNMVHNSLLSDINILENFNKITWYKLSINDDIKNIDFNSLSKKDIKILFNISTEKTLINYMITYNLKFFQNDNNYIKSIVWEENIWIIEKIKSIISNKETINIDDIDSIEMNESKITNNIKFDNTIYEWIKNNNKEIINKFLEAYDESGYSIITNFPKTFNLILQNKSTINIEKMINIKPDFYRLLPVNIQKNHTISYVKWIIKSNYNGVDMSKELAIIQFKNTEDMYTVFNLLDDKNKNNLLKKPLFLTNLNLFINNNKYEIIYFKNQDFIQKIMKSISLYIKEKQEIYDKYNESIKENKKQYIDKYNDQFVIENYNLANKAVLLVNNTAYKENYKSLMIAYCWEIITGDDWGKDNVIEDLFKEWLTKEEFKELLKESNKILKQLQQENNKELVDSKIKDTEKEILKSILTDWKIDETKLNNEAREFLKSHIEIELDNWEKVKYPSNKWKNNIIQLYLKEKYSNLNNNDIKLKLNKHLKLFIADLELNIQIKHSDKIYTAYKTWNFNEVNKLLKSDFKESLLNTSEKNKTTNNTNETVSNSNSKTTEANIYSSFELSTNNQSPEIKLTTWEKIQISQEEAKIVKSNPEAAENLINFYKFFKELNLESIWDYRKELMIAMWNRNINLLDNNSLSKSELLQFWNNLILAINNLCENNKELNKKPKLLITNSLSWVQNELRKFSWANSILSDGKTHNNKWEDKFAATLRNFWIIWWAYFKINTFREQINK